MAEDLAQGHTTEPEEGAGLVADPGWRPDPHGRFAYRWWNGLEWTASVTANDGRGVRYDPDPLPSAIAQLAPPAPGLPNLVTAVIGLAAGVGLTVVMAWVVDHLDHRPALAVLIIVSSIALWAPLVAALLVVSRRRGTGSIVRDFGFRIRWLDLGLGIAGALVGRIIAGVALIPIVVIDDDFADRTDRKLFGGDTVTAWTWIAAIAVICVGAPIIEELFFRGLLQNRLVQRFGAGVGIPVASVLFGAAHLIGWQGYSSVVQAWSVTFGGMVLGATYHYSKRLGTSIVAHGVFNAIAVLALWASSRT